MHILYIEDNANDAKLVQRYVETTPNDLVVVPTVEAAYECLSDSSDFDLILVDILINNKRSGYDFARVCQEQGYTRPIVAVTALASQQDMQAYAEAGFAAVLAKPYYITTLAELLSQFS